MFDTMKMANNIKNARTKLNMTQMNLADEMGVSYQAVSNWERGNSMPDISKLPDLCKILHISFEELSGQKNTKTDIVKRLMQNKGEEVTLEDLVQVQEVVKPEEIKSKVNENIKQGTKISFHILMNLAPFVDTETLNEMVINLEDEEWNFEKLCAIAPFLEEEVMDNIVEECMQQGNMNISLDELAAIAPFISESILKDLLLRVVHK
mgnify:FL=1